MSDAAKHLVSALGHLSLIIAIVSTSVGCSPIKGKKGLLSSDPEERHQAILCFARTSDPSMVPSLLDVALRDPDVRVRDEASLYLALFDHHSVAVVCRDRLKRATSVERQEISWLLSNKSDSLSFQLLQQLIDDRDAEVSRQAFASLKTSGDPGCADFLYDRLIHGRADRALWAARSLACGRSYERKVRYIGDLQRAAESKTVDEQRATAIRQALLLLYEARDLAREQSGKGAETREK